MSMTDAGAVRPTVFIAHPSDLLTDHKPNGDGLVAYGFLRELASRGTRLHIATREAALREPLPPGATLYAIGRRHANPMLDRLSYMLAARRLLARLKRTERIDLVHQMNPVFVGLSLGLVGCRLPVVLGTYVARWPGGEVGDASLSRFVHLRNGAARWLIRLLQQWHASALLMTTPAALDRISAPATVRRKLTTIRHGIDAQLFSPAEAPPPGAVSILFYSHLDRRKGVLVLVEAFRTVLRDVPGCRLVLVGRGEHEAEVRAAVAASGCAHSIDIRGPIPRQDAPALMRAHTVYCLPSFGEPYATTVLEAMACGRPLVITDAGGLPYMVPPDGGLRVPPGDAASLAAALIKILLSAGLQQSMGAANRAHILQHHTWARVVDDLDEVYARVADAKPMPALA